MDAPKPIVLPPVLFALPLILSVIIRFIVPLPDGGGFISEKYFIFGISAGFILMALGIALITWAGQTMARANVDPRFKPVGDIVQNGPFGYTRNPIYVSFTLIYLGITFIFNSLFALVTLPLVLAVLYFGVIKREEEYLLSKFGEEYKDYRSRVRRWL